MCFLGIHHASYVEKDPILVSTLFSKRDVVISRGVQVMRGRPNSLASLPRPCLWKGLHSPQWGLRPLVSHIVPYQLVGVIIYWLPNIIISFIIFSNYRFQILKQFCEKRKSKIENRGQFQQQVQNISRNVLSGSCLCHFLFTEWLFIYFYLLFIFQIHLPFDWAMLPGRGVGLQHEDRVRTKHAGCSQLKHLGQAPARGGRPHRVVRSPSWRTGWSNKWGVSIFEMGLV